MPPKTQRLWSDCLEKIKSRVPPKVYQNWFSPTRALGLAQNRLQVAAPDHFFKTWMEDHYGELIAQSLRDAHAPSSVTVEWVVDAAPSSGRESSHPAAPASVASAASIASEPPKKQVGLNPRYTFDTFVVGSSNRFAHAASLAVAQSPARAYNPLFIYGRVGLGKTHLMQAIGDYVLRQRPDAKVLYLSSERFTNDLITAIQNRTTTQFRQRYRHLDVLLIDDIHFIGGKESTQEEFFHTFNELYDAHKQIVISSDRPPKDIATLEERLVSRFEWGLITDIQPPELETRVAILRKKVLQEKVRVPDDVINFIAAHITSNIRELEGSLIRVLAYSSLIGTQITVAHAQEILRDAIFDEKNKKLTIEEIQRKVAEYFNIGVSDMRAKRRTKQVAYPRQVAMYLTRKLTEYSLPEIGEYFGGRNHTTVMHAIGKIEKEMQAKRESTQLVESLMFRLNSRL